MSDLLEAKRVVSRGREGVLLSNGLVRALVEAQGGMVPEFSIRQGTGYLNSHWIPTFRSGSGEKYAPARDQAFYSDGLLHDIAGDFPCSPTFGAGFLAGGRACPLHGWTSQEEWRLERFGAEPDGRLAYAIWQLRIESEAYPLDYRKYDILLAGQPVHYSALVIGNRGASSLDVNVAWHNCLGAPFLQAGCRVGLSADRFATPPQEGEEADTGRLLRGAEFESLAAVPLKSGGTVDVGYVPGMIGSTDFLVGAVPGRAALGWSSVVNPELGIVYASFFPGAATAPEGEIALGFNDLWMQYGGRRFAPWADYEGGTDRSFCLGAENAVGAFAKGLEYSLGHREILGAPTVVSIPAKGERRLCYGVALAHWDEGSALDGPSSGHPARSLATGVKEIEAEGERIILSSAEGSVAIPASGDFAALRKAVTELERA